MGNTISFNATDLWAVTANKIEVTLEDNLNNAKERSIELRTQIEVTEKLIRELTQRECDSHSKHRIPTIKSTITNLIDPDQELEIKVAPATNDYQERHGKRELGVTYTIAVERDKTSYTSYISLRTSIPKSQDLIRAEAAYVELKNQQTLAINKVMDCEKQVAKLPQLRKKCRAEVMETLLNETAEGKALLQRVEEGLQNLGILTI